MREVLALERVAATARQIAARQEQTDEQQRASVEACCSAVSITEVYRVEHALRVACIETQACYSQAVREHDTTLQDTTVHELLGRVRALCHELERIQTEALRAATVRVESLRARAR